MRAMLVHAASGQLQTPTAIRYYYELPGIRPAGVQHFMLINRSHGVLPYFVASSRPKYKYNEARPAVGSCGTLLHCFMPRLQPSGVKRRAS
jgi:hypothetical protein